jgi:hypothetical protein
MAASKKETTMWVRNARPNMIVFTFDGVRHVLAHRGNRQDSTALPIEAKQDNVISRWLKNGQLEEISRESFMKLGLRSVDTLPNEFLKRDVRNAKVADLELVTNKDDSSGIKIDIVAAQATKKAGEIAPEWAGDLMSTEEELEDFQADQQQNYQSKHRGN